MDVCHIALSLVDTFMKGNESASEIRNGKQVINIQQTGQRDKIKANSIENLEWQSAP